MRQSSASHVAHALMRAASPLLAMLGRVPGLGVEKSFRTPDLVEGAVSLSWGRSPTCPVPMQGFPTGQVGDLPHQGSIEIPTPPTLAPTTSGVRSFDTARTSACATKVGRSIGFMAGLREDSPAGRMCALLGPRAPRP